MPSREGGLRFRRDDGPGPAWEEVDMIVLYFTWAMVWFRRVRKAAASLFMDL